jgi:NADH:ubiquinone oxidoreductase subunit
MATLGTLLFTWLRGVAVGADEFGNRYYTERPGASTQRRAKRWVIYRGKDEASKVPAHWHGWLHYTHDMVPDAALMRRYPWQKEHLPNLTGTRLAYLPNGHLRAGGERAPTTSDYQAWSPE